MGSCSLNNNVSKEGELAEDSKLSLVKFTSQRHTTPSDVETNTLTRSNECSSHCNLRKGGKKVRGEIRVRERTHDR